MRAFIGIDFGTEIKGEIYDLQQKLRKYAQKGRWKYVDNFHLTLKFLGEIDDTQKGQIDAVMKELCIGRNPFELEVAGMGVFNGRDTIRVLWLGLAGGIQGLQSLHKEMDQALAPIGFPPEKRRFQPHVTIGQDILFKHGFDHIRDTLGNVHLGTLQVERLFLFKSEQVQNKRIYSKASEYSFTNGAYLTKINRL